MVLTAAAGKVHTELQVSLQTSLFGDAPIRCGPITQPRVPLDVASSLLFEPGWLQGSDQLFETLREEMPWQAMRRPMYDRVVDVPRLICTVRRSELEPEHPLLAVCGGLESATGCTFDSIGLNYYRSGVDSVAWHRDSIGRRYWASTTVALISLGEPRTLQIRRHKDATTRAATATPAPPTTAVTRRRWRLGHGDLFMMYGACQRDWEHCVPKESAVGPRISLALRCKEATEGPRLPGAGVPPLRASHKLQ